MPGSEEYFLGYNQDEIFKWVLAAEGHFRYVKPGSKSEDLACIVKHLAEIEGHSDEAVSHALIARGEDASRKYAELRDRAKDLRKKVQNSTISFPDGLKEIRNLRGYFESFNPKFDISKCSTCGSSEYVAQLQRGLGPMGRDKYLNPRRNNIWSVKEDMASVSKKDVLGIYGSELVAKAGEALFVQVDVATGKVGAPLHLRPSVWINMGLGVGIPLLALWRKMRNKWTLPLVVAGGHFFSKVVDYVQEVWAPLGAGFGTAYAATATQLGAGRGYVVKANKTVSALPIGTAPTPGRFAITG